MKYDNIILNLQSYITKYKESSNLISQDHKNNINGLLSCRNYFSQNFTKIIEDLNIIIEAISNPSNNSNNSNNSNKESEEVSPASIVIDLNRNWLPHQGNKGEGNVVKSTNVGGSYYCVKSEELLTGAFLCKIEIINVSGCGSWNKSAGIIKENSTNNDNNYYMDSVLFHSSGKIPSSKFSGSGDGSLVISEPWKNGDVIFIKRDYDNSIHFGLNDENYLKRAYEDVTGNFRIVLGFLSSSSISDHFEMIYLRNL